MDTGIMMKKIVGSRCKVVVSKESEVSISSFGLIMNNFNGWIIRVFKDLWLVERISNKLMRIFLLHLLFQRKWNSLRHDQIRRSSLSVCTNLLSFRKRDYHKHFLQKYSNCLGEEQRTLVCWLTLSYHIL